MLSNGAYLRVVIAAVAMLSVGVATACGTDPVGVETCRKIEGARCENANSCGIDLSKPVHRGDSPSLDVGACKRFYEDACQHGLVTTTDPGAVAADACVNAINTTTDCDIVKNPEKHPACAFLLPPAAPPEADAAAE